MIENELKMSSKMFENGPKILLLVLNKLKYMPYPSHVKDRLPTGCQPVFEFWAVGHGPQLLGIPSGPDRQPRFGCNRVRSSPVAGLLPVVQPDFETLTNH